MRILATLVIAALLGACATPPQARWLTQEEDAAMRARCMPVGGCALVPMPLWKQIESLLKHLAGTAL